MESIRHIFIQPPFEPWYRPLDVIIVALEQGGFGNNFVPMIFIQATISAATSVVLYLLTLELTKGKKLISLGPAILYPLTLGVIETTWLFMHKVILSDLLVILGVFAYIHYTKNRGLKWFALLLMCALVAPWIRELGGVLAAVVLLAAIAERRKDIKLIISLPILAFHALYASFFPVLILEQRIELQSIFQRASSGLFSSGVFSQSGAIGILNFDVPFKTVLLYSLIVTIALLVAVALFYFTRKNRINKIFGAVVLGILVLSLETIYSSKTSILSEIVPFFFIMTIVISSLRFGKLLPIWFVIPMIPFVFIPVHEAWLKMSAVPFIIIAFLWIAQLPSELNELFPKLLNRLRTRLLNISNLKNGNDIKQKLVTIPAVLLILLVVFAATNLVNAESTFKNNIITEQDIGKWAAENTANGSALISNLRQNWDFQYYSGDDILAYILDFRLKDPLPGGKGMTVDMLSYRFAIEEGHPEYYFIIAEKFGTVGFPQIKDEDLEKVATFDARCTYPVLDPLQLGLPDQYWRFGGPTDLKHEYDLRRGLFNAECKATFHIYKYIGSIEDLEYAINSLPPQFPTNTPRLLVEGYKGYNIISYGGAYYATSQIEGQFDLRRFQEGGYKEAYEGEAIYEVKENVDRHYLFFKPSLVEEGYRGYNIINYKGKFYAMPQSEGAFEPERIESNGYSSSFVGDSLEHVKLSIETPPLFVENFKGYNIFAYKGAYYGMPLHEGESTIQTFDNRDYSSSFTAKTIEELHLQIVLPHFIKSYRGFNIILYEGNYYAILQSDGQFDLTRLHNNSYTLLYVKNSLAGLEKQIDDITSLD